MHCGPDLQEWEAICSAAPSETERGDPCSERACVFPLSNSCSIVGVALHVQRRDAGEEYLTNAQLSSDCQSRTKHLLQNVRAAGATRLRRWAEISDPDTETHR